jgi:hypothetical protein
MGVPLRELRLWPEKGPTAEVVSGSGEAHVVAAAI